MHNMQRTEVDEVIAAAEQVMSELEAGVAALRCDDVVGLEAAIVNQGRACLQLRMLFEQWDRSLAGASGDRVAIAMAELRKTLGRYRAVLQHSSQSIYAVASLCKLHGGRLRAGTEQIFWQG